MVGTSSARLRSLVTVQPDILVLIMHYCTVDALWAPWSLELPGSKAHHEREHPLSVDIGMNAEPSGCTFSAPSFPALPIFRYSQRRKHEANKIIGQAHLNKPSSQLQLSASIWADE